MHRNTNKRKIVDLVTQNVKSDKKCQFRWYRRGQARDVRKMLVAGDQHSPMFKAMGGCPNVVNRNEAPHLLMVFFTIPTVQRFQSRHSE
jgi:hypothetical protein